MFATSGLKTFALPFGLTLGIGAAAGFLYYHNVEKVTWLRVHRHTSEKLSSPVVKTAKKVSHIAPRSAPVARPRPLAIWPSLISPRSAPAARPRPQRLKLPRSEPLPTRHRWHEPPLGFSGEIEFNLSTFSLPAPKAPPFYPLLQPPMA